MCMRINLWFGHPERVCTQHAEADSDELGKGGSIRCKIVG